MSQTVKNPPAMWETRARSLGEEDPLKKEMSTHPSILAQRIPWTKEPGGPQLMGLQSSQTKYLCKYLFSILWDICRSRISEPYDNYVFNSPTSPRVVYEGSDFSTSSPTLAVFWWFVLFCFVFNRHPSGSEVVFCCSFDLHFPNDKCLLAICVSFLENRPF